MPFISYLSHSAVSLVLASLAVLWSVSYAAAEQPGGASSAQPNQAIAPAVSFELDIQPILTSTGCNAGACHGKQRGQNGFQLSLLAFDSDFDFDAIVANSRGRRVFPAAPSESLLLKKATAEVAHGGGERFSRSSTAYSTIAKWIEQGAMRAVDYEPRLVSVDLSESAYRLSPEESQSLQVVASYSDGSTRDVTTLSTYLSNDTAIVSVDRNGVIRAGKLPGETAIMARFMNHIKVANAIIPYSSKTETKDLYSSLPRENFIDDLVFQKLQVAATLPSEPADEATFLRRVFTDLIGRLPTAVEARTFLEDQTPHKREYLIDGLLERPEYADHWANQWVDLLRPNPYRVGIKAVLNYDNWIRQQFRDNVAYDEFARQLITAKGSTWRNGSVTLYRDRRTPDEAATLVSQLFLGIRLECAKCHHHPFENWSQQDFYQFSAFFANVGMKGTGLSPPISGGEEIVFTSTKGQVFHPISGKALAPKPLFGQADQTAADSSTDIELREELARWIASPDNQFFAQVQVNRLWAAMMGRGFVEPVDDIRSTNPASNPQLFAALAKAFQESGFDNKVILKLIAMSQVYSLSSVPNPTNMGDRLNYSRHYRHRFRAEVLADAIADITETDHEMRGMPTGSRANQVWTHRVDSMFLDTFGRPDENQDPPCERTTDSTVTQALHLMNSKELDRRIRSDSGRAARLAKSNLSSLEIVNDLYLCTYSRYPRPDELEFAVELLESAEDKPERPGDSKRRRIEDLMWAMLNSPECVIQN